MNDKWINRAGQGACLAFCLAAAGVLYGNSRITEIDATVLETGLHAGLQMGGVVNAPAILTDKGVFATANISGDALQAGSRYHLKIYKTTSDPYVLGVAGTIRQADRLANPAP